MVVPPAPPAPPLPAARGVLTGASIYAYSFLDVREDVYTPKVLDQIKTDLAERFGLIGAKLTSLAFKDTEVARRYSSAVRPGLNSTYVPVELVMLRNRGQEREAGAKYRLLIFPSNYTVSGSWRFYEIRWELIEVRSGRRVWGYTYSGKHLVLWRSSENSKARSKKIVDALFAQLVKDRLI